jgi:hypothetical protein
MDHVDADFATHCHESRQSVLIASRPRTGSSGPLWYVAFSLKNDASRSTSFCGHAATNA